ncbi:MAG TPA: FkbM family methyltransferase [Candidatus Binatia bacterium]|nr:FkbM family methyltransferase [Candidatus Binatia bacterium]
MPGTRSFAQWGEDVLVWDYFHRQPRGFFIEVGANDPVNISQTYLLELNGWEGILVEPQAACCERLRPLRPRSKVVQAACGGPEQKGKAWFRLASSHDRSALASQMSEPDVTFTGTVEVDLVTLDDVLETSGNPKPDFVSIDVEGGELAVLRGFNLARHHPALLLVEDHVHDLALHSYLCAHRYKLVKRTGSNNWYVPQETEFPISLGEWLRLFRKMRLGTPLRRLKSLLRGL